MKRYGFKNPQALFGTEGPGVKSELQRFRGMRRTEKVVSLIAATAVLLLLAPNALATEQANGEVTVTGHVTIVGPGSVAFGDVLALVAPELVAGSRLTIEDDASNLCYVTKSFTVADTPIERIEVENGAAKSESCNDFAHMALDTTLGYDPHGYVGIYPDSMVVVAQDFDNLTAEPRLASYLASDEGDRAPTEVTPRASIYYANKVEAPNVLVEVAGQLTGTFSGQIKIRGLNLDISSDSGRNGYVTGTTEPNGPAGERIVRIAILTVTDAKFTFTSPALLLLAAREAEISVEQGGVEFRATGGSLASDEANYAPRHGLRDTIEGTLTATLLPSATDGTGILSMSGALSSTSLERVPVPVAPVSRRTHDWGLVAIGAVLTSGVAVGALLTRRRAGLVTSDDLIAYYRFYAELAEEIGDFNASVAWLAPAIALAPHNADLVRQQMLYHRHAGDLALAIEAGDRAARLASPIEGTVDYYVAAFYLEKGGAGAHEQARIHLERALARQPGLARTVSRDDIFEPLHGRDFGAMLQEAFARSRAPTVDVKS